MKNLAFWITKFCDGQGSLEISEINVKNRRIYFGVPYLGNPRCRRCISGSLLTLNADIDKAFCFQLRFSLFYIGTEVGGCKLQHSKVDGFDVGGAIIDKLVILVSQLNCHILFQVIQNWNLYLSKSCRDIIFVKIISVEKI